MQKLFFIIISILFLQTAHAQKYCKPSGFAFSITTQPGTIAVDESGAPMKRHIQKERFVYLITPGNSMPVITSVAYANTVVKWSVQSNAAKIFSAVSEKTQKTMNIKPPKGCSMWRVDIQEISGHPILENIASINIKGKTAGKSFTIFLNKENAVQGFDAY